MSEFVRVGQIVGAFGIRGEVKVKALTDFVERFDEGRRLRLQDDWTEIVKSYEHKGMLILTLSAVKNRTKAENLQWEYLEALADERPELDEDEYMTEDLYGLKVVTVDGEELGEVDDVLGAPAHDVLVVGEIMIPVVQQFVKEIDLEEERIVVELIPGMRPGEE